MPAITAADVAALRRATGAGMMDAKNALVSCDGDATAAAQMLRERGIAKSDARSDRDDSEGIVVARVEETDAGCVGAIVELRCETDFVAKSEDFAALAAELLDAVIATSADAAAELAPKVEDLRIALKENINVGRIERFEAASTSTIDAYVHQQNGRGVNAVLVQLDGGSGDAAHDVALHVASTRPTYLSRDDVPADIVEAERATLTALSRNEGKPEAALDKIVEGRLTGFFRDNALLEQKFVKDEKVTIAQLIGDAQIARFAQVIVGS